MLRILLLTLISSTPTIVVPYILSVVTLSVPISIASSSKSHDLHVTINTDLAAINQLNNGLHATIYALQQLSPSVSELDISVADTIVHYVWNNQAINGKVFNLHLVNICHWVCY